MGDGGLDIMKCGNLRVMKLKAMLLLLFSTCSLAGVNRVPSDYPTIQSAIDASMDGDTVLVAPGTYTGDGNRDIDFKGKAITVKSEEGPQTCIIDCQGSEDEQHRGFYFHSDEDTNSVVEGFTVTYGYYTDNMGGGIYCDASSPLIKNCIVAENTAWLGGGIACDSSNAVIINCIIISNRARLGTGGGIFCIYGSPHILDCLITDNTADVAGGVGIGRIGDRSSLLTMTNCFITGNKAKGSGGGMYCNGEITITNCFIIGNKAKGSGGIECSGKITLLNCTISGNRTDYNGGGGGIQFSSAGKVSNSIIYGNIAPRDEGKEIYLGPYGAGGCDPDLIKITHSVVGNDPNAINIPRCLSGEWLYADPLFANPGYWNSNRTPDDPNDDFWVDGDYHLKSQYGRWYPNTESWVVDDVTSPCIDAGDPNSPVGDEPEPNGGRINMGAYGGTAEASKSGSSWWFETTQGPIAADGLGVILPHEHIFTDLRGPGTRDYGQADVADVVRVMAPLLEEAKDMGVGLLFECSSIGVGRNVSILSEVSAVSGLPVVVPTGVYGRANFAPPEHKNMSEDELTELFISEIRDGIEGTSIKAGFIKIATGGSNMTALEEKFLRAAGRAARETGAAVASHTNTSNNVTRQVDILESISPEIRFIWVHAQSVNNLSLYRQLAERGVFIEFDSLGWNPGQDSTFITAIKDLLAAGYGEQILLSHDAGWYQPGEQNGGSQMPYTYLIETFIPKLRDSGVDDEAIRMITETNPIRAFGFNQDVRP